MGQRAPTPPAEQLKEAEQLARSHNMFFTRKGEEFTLYRRTPSRPVFLGKRSTPAALRQLVSRCAACQ